ncbi:primosomal protein N' [Chloroflexota bacterium]
MENRMRYAEVSVNSPIAQRQTFSYAIPDRFNLEPGQAVWVPFGSRVIQGIIIALSAYPAVEDTREIIGVIEEKPVLSPQQIALAHWISDYYLAPLFSAIALMLPPGFERKAGTWLHTTDNPYIMSTLSPEAQNLMELAHLEGNLSLKELEKKLGKRKAQSLVSQLVRKNLLARDYKLEPLRVSAKKETFLIPTLNRETARETAAKLRQQGVPKQSALLEFLAEQPEKIRLKELRKNTSFTRPIINALVAKGYITMGQVEVKRDPLASLKINPSSPHTLSPAQEKALRQITEAIARNQPAVFLLHGVTGSGKTEIYLRAMAETIKRNKKGILLVPEIALTPQTIERVFSRFPQQVAVLHSKLSLGEQFDQWHRIQDGDCNIVIGSRSAIFSPQPDLGLIVIDEEHEWTYKQNDTAPRYHARSVALKLAELTGAVVLLGSATPDVETYYHARKGNYHLLELPERVVPSATLPPVEIVDMRQELKAGNRSIFSRRLQQEISRTISNHEQVILFLNRRGGATFIQCRNCGFTLRCRRCDTSLSFHPSENMLTCHQCNYHTAVPETCPRCYSRKLKFLGLGTQKLEQETQAIFPESRHLRWDSDATTGKHSHGQMLNRFRNHEVDILIGTQMVAKGLDLPSVTLVGVASADTALNLPDFRAGERTFQLLSQVAGRAGRGSAPGQVIIQTFSPEHYAIRAAANHDYLSFYRQEIEYRQKLHNPPFTRLASLVYTHTNEGICQREALKMRNIIITEKDRQGIAGLTIIGPAPAFMPRLRGRYRWQLVLRGGELSMFLSTIPLTQGWTVDIDPITLI